MQCLQFCNISSCIKNVQNQIKFLFGVLGFSKFVARLVTNCYCEKLFLSLFLFRVFFVVVVTK